MSVLSLVATEDMSDNSTTDGPLHDANGRVFNDQLSSRSALTQAPAVEFHMIRFH